MRKELCVMWLVLKGNDDGCSPSPAQAPEASCGQGEVGRIGPSPSLVTLSLYFYYLVMDKLRANFLR